LYKRKDSGKGEILLKNNLKWACEACGEERIHF
jgi:hypothetical protein